MPLAAVLQLNGSSDISRNMATTERFVREAAAAGARFVATPEATTYLGPHREKVQLAESIDGPTHQRLGQLARELKIGLLIGSVAERGPDEGPEGPTRSYNTSLLFGPDGRRVATYRKMHLFDVDLASSGGVTFLESERTIAGDDIVVADTPIGRMGLSICYDLRFPEMYRRMVDQGATCLAVPAAFTLMTGKDHWEVLLRARAIESQAWVFAPAQWGPHDDGGLRRSYGHACIIDPWGKVVAACGEGEGWCIANIDVERVNTVRRQMPVQIHRRL